MTVSSEVAAQSFMGNGAQVTFPCGFKVFDEDHVQVFVDGVEQTLTTHYTVSGVGDASFNVVFVTAPAAGTTINVVRVVPLLQETDYLDNDEFPAETHERALDLLTMMVQQLSAGNQGKPVHFPPSDPGTLTGLLPPAATRASKLLGFDSTGEVVAVEGGDLGAFTTGDPHTWTALQTFDEKLRVESDSAVGATALPVLEIARTKTAAVDDIVGDLQFEANNSDSDPVLYGAVRAEIADPAAGAEDGRLAFHVMFDGTLRSTLKVGAGYILALKSDAEGAGPNPKFQLNTNKAVLSDGDVLGHIDWRGNNDAAEKVSFASLDVVAESDVDGAEFGRFRFLQMRDGAQVTSLSPGVLLGPFATTSGTAVDVTGIPAGARKITVMFMGVSTNGTSPLQLRLGTSAGVVATGYVGTVGDLDETPTQENLTTAFNLRVGGVAANALHGTLELHLGAPSANTWIAAGTNGFSVGAAGGHVAGSISLPGVLDRIRLLTANTYDAGSFSLLVE